MSNRLEKEDSPYLQLYKDTPVDWWPWCDEAFQKAKLENKAIFISIGYSSCHLCHLMREEVFEDTECSEILNKNFISIKVDKEEHPDIDKYYQEVYQMLNRRAGGWPTSIFATPLNKAFFAGTYIAPESTGDSIEGMGFKELATLIASKIDKNDEQVYKNAQEIDDFMKKVEHPTEATVLKEEFYKNFLLQAQHNFDTKHAGFSSKPKFPHTSTLNALLHIEKLYGQKSAKSMLIDTLNAMKKGGIYDHIDGAFYRYSKDEAWFIPHFEKTLYDNASLIGIYTDAYLAYGDNSYLQVAKNSADFWHNYMSEKNLFYSSSDTHSEGEEGKYFTYTYDEVASLLQNAGYEKCESMCAQMSITPEGNFEGRSVIHFEDEIPSWFKEIKPLLSKIRSSKEYPFVNKKVQTSWSSMMINSLLKLGAIDSLYTKRAIDNLDALLESTYIDGQLYHTTLIGKKPKVEAFLEDYAFLAQALLNAYKYTNDELHLINAQRVCNKALEEFYNQGLWNFSSGEFATKATINDTTYTSGVSVMVENLIILSTLLEDEKYSHFAFKTLEYNSYELGRKPILSPHMLIQVLHYLKGEYTIKTSIENITNSSYELAKLFYPFLSYKTTHENGYLLHVEKECFATTSEIEEINTLIKNSF